MKKKSICVIGLGYIGLPTAALIANKGFSVSGVDTSQQVISALNQGDINTVEADLSKFIKSAISSGKLKFFSNIQQSDVYMICVPTPLNIIKDKPHPNIDHVLEATKRFASFIKPGDLIILESTSPVGTTEKIQKILSNYTANLEDIHIAYCPERVLPGKIMTEIVENDRIVGGINSVSTKKIKEFYSSFVKGKIFGTDAKTAEMCKLAENSFRDLNIAFANELSIICENNEIDVWNLISLANKHPRVNILNPGAGVGGHCIAVDPWFIISENYENANLIRKSREVNNYKTKWVIDKIKSKANNYLLKTNVKPKILCLGLAFKPDINDLRESQALKIVETLLSDGYEINAVEPNITSYKNLKLFNLIDGIENADIICILVKHREFLQSKIKNKLIKLGALDYCGALN